LYGMKTRTRGPNANASQAKTAGLRHKAVAGGKTH
jgi:hypothetical protein